MSTSPSTISFVLRKALSTARVKSKARLAMSVGCPSSAKSGSPSASESCGARGSRHSAISSDWLETRTRRKGKRRR